MTSLIKSVALHAFPKYAHQCSEILCEEWGKSNTARLVMLEKSCESLPYNIVLLNSTKTLLLDNNLNKFQDLTGNNCQPIHSCESKPVKFFRNQTLNDNLIENSSNKCEIKHKITNKSLNQDEKMVHIQPDNNGPNFIDHNWIVIGHSRLCAVAGQSKAVFVESVVIAKKYRGKGFGRILMEETEKHAKRLNMDIIYLTTHDKCEFYSHLGFEFCQSIVSLGNCTALLSPKQIEQMFTFNSDSKSLPLKEEEVFCEQYKHPAPPICDIAPPPLPALNNCQLRVDKIKVFTMKKSII